MSVPEITNWPHAAATLSWKMGQFINCGLYLACQFSFTYCHQHGGAKIDSRETIEFLVPLLKTSEFRG